jgi:hypothetical protein
VPQVRRMAADGQGLAGLLAARSRATGPDGGAYGSTATGLKRGGPPDHGRGSSAPFGQHPGMYRPHLNLLMPRTASRS